MSLIKLFPNATPEDFQVVWNWSDDQIVQFLRNLANSNDGVRSLVDLEVASLADVAKAAGKIVYMLDTQGVGSVSQADIDNPNLTFRYSGHQLHLPTVYDQLGFILSATGTLPAGLTATPNGDYYLPVLSLYAKWCNWLAVQCMEPGQQMQHISYFPGAKNKSHILLGSSIGSKNDGLRRAVLNNRIDHMTALKLKRPQADMNAPASNYGVCAETILFIYYGDAQLGDNGARGFALNTNERVWEAINNEIKTHAPGITPYKETDMVQYLRAPCQQSCQNLMAQLGLDPATCFDITKIKET